MKRGSRHTRSALVTLGALIGGLLLTGAPALAAGPHKFSKAVEAPPAEFHEPWGLAIGPAGEVFVINNSSSIVDVYSSAGTFEAEFEVETTHGENWGIAVDDSASSPSKGDVYIGTFDGYVLKYEYDALTKTATKAAKITTGQAYPIAVTVDSHGDLYVVGFEPGDVNKYGPDGTLITEHLISGATFPQAIAVDSSGNIYVGGGEGVREYSESGTCLNGCAAFGGVTANTIAITVGPEGYVYVDQEGGAEETSVLESDGTLVESFDPAHLIHAGYGIGVSGTTVFVTNEANSEVAEFTPGSVVPEYPLTVSKAGTGKGTVTSEQQPGINCGTACTHEFPEGENVKLKEAPAPGSTFTKWEDCTVETSGECEVTMSAAMEVKAEYTANTLVGLTPTYAGSGTGEVKCEVDKEGGFVACAADYSEGTELVLEGTEAAGSTFEGWSAGTGSASSCSGTGPCAFTIDQATTITATFNKATTFPLTVNIAGEGRVESNPVGIACTQSGGTCTASYKGPVTLVATKETGYVFVGWLGCEKTMETTCEVNVTTETEVTAVFLKEGNEGPKGETGPQGPKGETGPKGERGEQGAEGFEGFEGAPGAKGAAGANGAQGAPGPVGTQGPAGPLGPAGPAGPAGKEGPPGKVQIVTCTGKGHKKRCATKTVSGTVTFTTSSAHAMLSRRGVVYAAGTASRRAHGFLSLRLISLRKLKPGRYMLTLISGSGRQERIHSETFVLR